MLDLIDSRRSDFEDFGGVAFETRTFQTAGGRQSRRFALLNEQQATLLMTFQRNTDRVVAAAPFVGWSVLGSSVLGSDVMGSYEPSRSTLSEKVLTPMGITVIVLATLVLCFGLGWWVTAANLASANASNDSTHSALDKAHKNIEAYQAKEDASSQAQQEAEDLKAELEGKIAAADATQKELDAAKQKVADSQLTDGVHVVGTDTEPGVYSTTDTTDCYYAWMTGTGSDAEIVDNNIVSGPATVTLKAGDVFETNRCGTWNKTG